MRRILKAVTTKYMLIFMALILLTVVILGAMVATILSNYSVDTKMNELSNVNVMFKSYFQSTDNENFELALKDTQAELESTLSYSFLITENCQVIAADKDGNIIMHAYNYPYSTDYNMYYFSEERLIKSLLNGSTVPSATIISIGDKGDLSMNNSCNELFVDNLVWCASPLTNASGDVSGYVISFTDIGGEGDSFSDLLQSIALTVLWLLFVAMIAIYIVTYKVMSPLQEISNAAKSFARGKYDVRVRERGNDEVADLARSFNKMAIEIQSKDDMQKQFLSNASHDLRTPMTTIAGFIDGILDGAIPKDRQEYYLNIIKSEVQRLSRLVSSLLDISRLQSGERKFDKKPFNICELARQTIISFENQFNEKQLDVEFDVEQYDMVAIGDKDAINQVVYNLCHNAIKFSYEKGKYIVKIRYCENNKIRFSVYNEGIGIAQDDLPYVFDRFYKSDKSRGLDKTGVGLGLFISKTIVEAHDGEIKVESIYKEWCEFSFTLTKGEKLGN